MRADDVVRLGKVLRQPLLLLSPAGEVIAANPAATDLLGIEVGSSLSDVLADPASLDGQLTAWLRTGGPVPARLELLIEGEPTHARADVGRVSVGAEPTVLVCLRDVQAQDRFARITDQLQALQRETRHRRRAEYEQQAALAAERRSRKQLERLQGLTAALASAVTGEDTIEAILAHAPAVVGHEVVVALGNGPDGAELRPRRDDIAGVGVREHWLADVPQPLRDALGQRQALLYSSADEVLDAYPQLRDARGPSPSQYLAAAIPMAAQTGQAPVGVLGFLATEGSALSQDHLVAAGIVAAQCGQALDRARLYDAERRFAETLQRALLPSTLPETKGVDCAVRYLPAAERSAVGGDWYAVIALGGGRVGLAVGDVAGHGRAAATSMGTMRSGLRALASTNNSPAAVLEAFNAFVCAQLPDDMATVFYLVADTDAGTLTYANAGHLPPLLVEPGAMPRYLERALQPPVGVSPDIRYEEDVLPFDLRCGVVLYTDGLVERRSEDIDIGLSRLHRATGAEAEQTDPDVLCDHLLGVLVGDQPLTDDAAVLVANIARQRERAPSRPSGSARDRSASPDRDRLAPSRPCSTNTAPPEPPTTHLLGHRRARKRDSDAPQESPARAQARSPADGTDEDGD